VAVSHIQEGIWLSRVPLSALDEVEPALSSLDMVSSQLQDQHLEAYISLENLGSPQRLEETVRAIKGAQVQRHGLVSLIGYGIGGRPQWWIQAQALLKAQAIEPVASFQSVARLSWVLPREQVAQAAQLLHTSFCL
jgi:aspartokinase